MRSANHGEFGRDVIQDASGEIRRTRIVERHRHDTTKYAAKKCRDPFRAIRSPKQDAIPFCKAALVKQCREASDKLRDFTIGMTDAPKTQTGNHGDLATMRLKIVYKGSQVFANGSSIGHNVTGFRIAEAMVRSPGVIEML